jgi:hypothetical protein
MSQETGSAVVGKVLVNLATGMEGPERETVAFLVATAAVDQGKSVVIWATKDAVRRQRSWADRGGESRQREGRRRDADVGVGRR